MKYKFDIILEYFIIYIYIYFDQVVVKNNYNKYTTFLYWYYCYYYYFII